MTTLPDTALSLRAALRAGELSARDAVEESLNRIADAEDLGAFISVNPELALREAEAADAYFAANRSDPTAIPSLHGMPTAHKDLSDVAGVATTHGSAALPSATAATDSAEVRLLRRAGTISLGKTQVPEFGLTGYSENLIAPPACNPHDPERTAGGSSGGSAAAVAAGLLPLAPGSDGGGSIRIPALACGLIGLKPGLGTIPSDPAQDARDSFGAPRLTVSGPLARTPQDAALLFDAMRGTAGEPSLTAVAHSDGLRGLRVGISTVSPFESAHPTPLSAEALAAFTHAAHLLEQRQHHVEEAEVSYLPNYPEAFTTSWTAALSLLRLEEGAEDLLTPFTRCFRERARSRGDAAHHHAAAQLRRFASEARAQWGRYDVILTPGLAFTPPRIGAFTSLSPDDDYRLQCEWAPFTSMVNVAGLPAIAVPIDGPHSWTGVQLIGRAGSEIQLLQLATQLTE
ncbi:amidase [Leucobacter insecticola]|uniref:Amidase n=1 Tax=Leucobacter insecticola TaxID=2714934 RepID=A0A6G8FGI0_9MICO|nr:amidase [Leucobacter insecticola]QIM15626.1 amidase [Leucobacter insecticola]